MNHPILPRNPRKTSVQVTQRVEDFGAPRAEDSRFPRKRGCHRSRIVRCDELDHEIMNNLSNLSKHE